MLYGNPRVCLITNEYPPAIGGVGQSARRVASLLVEAGIDLEVLVLMRHESPLPLDESITSEEKDGIVVHRARVWMPGWATDPAKRRSLGSEAVTRFNRESFEVVRHLQKTRSYDLLHGFFLYPAGFLAATVARLVCIRSVVSIRGNDVGRNAFDPQLRSFISTALEQADYVTSVATSLLEFADKTICSVSGKSRVILNSCDTRGIECEVPTNVALRRPVVGAAGVFRYKKGLLYLFKALSELQHSREFSLLLAGGFRGPQEEEIHLRQLREYGLVDRTTITGMMTHSQMQGHLRLFDVIAFPSLFSEGCPMTMLEAMSVRCAVVASRSGAIPEVIMNEENGLLFDVGDWKKLGDHIRRLLDNPELRRALADQAHSRIAALSLKSEQEAWLEVYQLALSRPG